MYRDPRDTTDGRQARPPLPVLSTRHLPQRPPTEDDEDTYLSTPSDNYERPSSSSSALRGRFDSFGFSARRRSNTSSQLEVPLPPPPPFSSSSRPIASRPHHPRHHPDDRFDDVRRPHSSSGIAVESRLPPVPQDWGVTYNQPTARVTSSSYAKSSYPPATGSVPAIPPNARSNLGGSPSHAFAFAIGGSSSTAPGSSSLAFTQSAGATPIDARPSSSGRRPFDVPGPRQPFDTLPFGQSNAHQQVVSARAVDRPVIRRRSNTTQVEGIGPWYGPSGTVHDASHHGIPPAPEAAPPSLTSLPLMDPDLEPRSYHLHIRQQPTHGRMFGFRSRERRPLDPLPIIELTIRDRNGEIDWFAQTSPDLLMQVSLITDVAHEDELVSSSANPSATMPQSRLLEGKLASSGHIVKDLDGERACFFLFPDLSVRVESMASLHFSLLRLGGPTWESGGSGPAGRVVAEVTSDPFQIHSPRTYPGIGESTELAKCLAAQGVAVPIRNQGRK
ncbi:Velvet factor [Ceraceosorus bombacis]|uniref:Velvet factor n=1 Tax=Ceraceosorus bombacis TaxID=401625 RepID=A0A0P1B9P0_9BASI|nr:Velvet factor [Ceraceosorus bombacis]